MSKENNCSIGTLLIMSDQYQTWLQKKPVETLGIVIDIKEQAHNDRQKPLKYLIVKWDDKPDKDDWIETKAFETHLKGGYIRVASEG